MKFLLEPQKQYYFPVLHKRHFDEKTDIGNGGDNCMEKQLIDTDLGNIGTFLEERWGYQQRTTSYETL